MLKENTSLAALNHPSGRNAEKKSNEIECAEDLVALFAIQELVKEGQMPVELFSRILDSYGPNIDRTIFA